MRSSVSLFVLLVLVGGARADEQDPLLDLLAKGTVSERAYVARLLGESGAAGDVEPLIAALSDEQPVVRLAAIRALAGLGDARALPALRAAAQDADADVRRAAGEAAERIGAQTARALRTRRPPGMHATHVVSDFEGSEPPSGWRTFAEGKSVAPAEEPAHGGRRSLRIEAGPDGPRCDGLAFERPLPRLMYEAAVLPDPTPGRSTRVGLLGQGERDLRLFNAFELVCGDAGKIALSFGGRLGDAPVSLGEHAAGQWVELRAELDLVRCKGDLYVGGARVAADVPLQPVAFRDEAGAPGGGVHARVMLQRWGVWVSPSATCHIDDIHFLGVGPAPRGSARARGGKAQGIDELLAQLKNGDVRARRDAIDAIQRSDDPRVVPALIEALSDPEARVRLGAAQILCMRKDVRAVPALITCLEDKDVNVRRASVDALAEIGDPRAGEALLRALAASEPDLRHAIILALGATREPKAIDPLFDLLEKDQQFGSVAAAALSRYGATVVPRLVDLLGKPSPVSDRAMEALRFARAPAVPALLEALSSPDARVRYLVVAALAVNKEPSVVQALDMVLRTDADTRVRGEAARALRQTRDVAAVPALTAALSDRERSVRYAAAEALGMLRDPRAVAPLAAALGDDDPQLRILAASALGHQRGPAVVDALLQALHDERPEIRDCVISALGEQDDPRARETLLSLAKSDDPEVRGSVAAAFSAAKDEASLAALVAALRDPVSVVRLRAAVVLEGRKWSPRDTDDRVWFLVARGRCAEAARKGPAALAALIVAIQGEDPSVRREASEALVTLGKDAVGPLLEVRRTNRDPGVLREVGRALNALGWTPDSSAEQARLLVEAQCWDEVVKLGAAAIDPLVEALGSPEGRVRAAAAQALERLGWKPPDDVLRARYLVAAGRFDEAAALGEPALEPLITALGSRGRFDVAGLAAGALGKLGDRRAVPPLIRLLETGGRAECAAAAGALAKLRDPRAVAPLVAVLERPWDPMHEPDVTLVAAEALGDLGMEEAIPALKAALTRKVPALEQADGTDPMVAALRAQLRATRCVVAAALLKLGDADSLESVVAALADPFPRVRFHAATALGEAGTAATAAQPALTKALDDAVPEVREAARRALKRMGTPSAEVATPDGALRFRKGDAWKVQMRGARGTREASLEVVHVFENGAVELAAKGFLEESMTWRITQEFLLWEIDPAWQWRVWKFGAKPGDEWKPLPDLPEANAAKAIDYEECEIADGETVRCLKVEHRIGDDPPIRMWWTPDGRLVAFER